MAEGPYSTGPTVDFLGVPDFRLTIAPNGRRQGLGASHPEHAVMFGPRRRELVASRSENQSIRVLTYNVLIVQGLEFSTRSEASLVFTRHRSLRKAFSPNAASRTPLVRLLL